MTRSLDSRLRNLNDWRLICFMPLFSSERAELVLQLPGGTGALLVDLLEEHLQDLLPLAPTPAGRNRSHLGRWDRHLRLLDRRRDDEGAKDDRRRGGLEAPAPKTDRRPSRCRPLPWGPAPP